MAVLEEQGRQAIDLMTPRQKRVESYVGGVRNCKYRSALDLTLIYHPGLEAILRWEHQDGGPEPWLYLESPGSVFSEISRRNNSEIKLNERSPTFKLNVHVGSSFICCLVTMGTATLHELIRVL